MIQIRSKGGITRWIEPPKPEPKPRPSKARCGTISGYTSHIRRGERPCFDCAEASRTYQRKRRGVTKVRELKPHGTYAAYTRHYAAGSPPCGPCIEANRIYQREARARQRAKKTTTATETRAA